MSGFLLSMYLFLFPAIYLLIKLSISQNVSGEVSCGKDVLIRNDNLSGIVCTLGGGLFGIAISGLSIGRTGSEFFLRISVVPRRRFSMEYLMSSCSLFIVGT